MNTKNIYNKNLAKKFFALVKNLRQLRKKERAREREREREEIFNNDLNKTEQKRIMLKVKKFMKVIF